MRPSTPLFLLLALAGCSLVIDGRTDPYEGACEDEEEAVNDEYRVGDGIRRQTVPQIARDCFGCPAEDCVEACISGATGGAVTIECASCFADAALCASTWCPGLCTEDTLDMRPCEECTCEHGCAQALNECSGLTMTTCR